MKVWPIDPLIAESFSLEVSEKLPQGLAVIVVPSRLGSVEQNMDIFASSSSQDFKYYSQEGASSDPLGSSQKDAYDHVEVFNDLSSKDLLRLKASNSVDLAISILRLLPVQQKGWCELVTLKPSKDYGYIQVSHAGQNKFAVLQEVVLWAKGAFLLPNEHASHLCGNPACRIPGHIVPELPVKNNARKNCIVWIDCPHCEKKILVCDHDPICIKYAKGFLNMDDLLSRGICFRTKKTQVI